jgi:hypothetical protein
MECISNLVLIGNNGYHGYPSSLCRGASGDEKDEGGWYERGAVWPEVRR